MTKRVLDVGNCGFDHAAIRRVIEGHFDAQVDQADQTTDALQLLGCHDYALILVNRKLDCDYSDGLRVIRAIKDRPEYAHLPVMMITNFAEHQAAATAAGAVEGFGKNSLEDIETIDRLAAFLG